MRPVNDIGLQPSQAASDRPSPLSTSHTAAVAPHRRRGGLGRAKFRP